MVWGFGSTTTYNNDFASFIAKNYINSIKKTLETVKEGKTIKLTIFEFIKDDGRKIQETTKKIISNFTGSYFAYAVWKNKLRVVKLFLESVTPDEKFKLMQTGISVCDKEDYLKNYTSFQVAVRKGYVKIVTLFLESVTPDEKFKLLSELGAGGKNSICIAVLSTEKMFNYIFQEVNTLNNDQKLQIINYPTNRGQTPLAFISEQISTTYVFENETKRNKYNDFYDKLHGVGGKQMSYDELYNYIDHNSVDSIRNGLDIFKNDPKARKRIIAPSFYANSLIIYALKQDNPNLNILKLLLDNGAATLNKYEIKLFKTNIYKKEYLSIKNKVQNNKNIMKLLDKIPLLKNFLLSQRPPPPPPKNKTEWSNVRIKF